jgi:hypothetical protein
MWRFRSVDAILGKWPEFSPGSGGKFPVTSLFVDQPHFKSKNIW